MKCFVCAIIVLWVIVVLAVKSNKCFMLLLFQPDDIENILFVLYDVTFSSLPAQWVEICSAFHNLLSTSSTLSITLMMSGLMFSPSDSLARCFTAAAVWLKCSTDSSDAPGVWSRGLKVEKKHKLKLNSIFELNRLILMSFFCLEQ